MLTIDFVSGTPLSRAGSRLDAMPSPDREALATGLMSAVLSQILLYGVFHADLHPGDVILRDDGSLGLIDFGAVGIVERSQRDLITTLLLTVLTEDDATASDVLLMVVTPPPGLDVAAFRHDVGVVLTSARHGGAAAGSIFARILDVIREHRIAIPSNLAAAFRSFATLEGCLAILSPSYDLVQHALPLIPRLVERTISPRRTAIGAQTRAVVTAAQLERLPRQVDGLITAIRAGTLGAGSTVAAAAADARRDSVGQLTATLISVTACVLAVVLVTVRSGPVLAGGVHAFDLLGATLGLFGFLGALRVVRTISSPSR